MELKDYLHYYIGHDCEVGSDSKTLIRPISGHVVASVQSGLKSVTVKPILRTMDMLTDEEKVKWYDLWPIGNPSTSTEGKINVVTEWQNEKHLHTTPPEFHYLLSIGIDRFGLIDNGLAIKKPL